MLPLDRRVLAVEVLVLQLSGNGAYLSGADVGERSVNGKVGGIGFGSGCHQHHRVGKGNPRLGKSHHECRVNTGFHDRNELRIGKSDVLAGADHQPSADGGKVVRLDQSGKVVNRRVRIGTAQGFLERGENVVMLLSVPVVAEGAALGQLLCPVERNLPHAVFRHAGHDAQFHRIERFAHVASAADGDSLAYAFLDLESLAEFLLHKGKGALHAAFHFFRRHGLEFKHSGTAEDSGIYVKIGILRGGSDESDFPVLDEFQKRLLLLFCKILNLVKVEQNPVLCHEGIQFVHDVLDVLGGSGSAVEPVQTAVGLGGDNACQCGLSDARRPVKYHVGDAARFDDFAKGAVFT